MDHKVIKVKSCYSMELPDGFDGQSCPFFRSNRPRPILSSMSKRFYNDKYLYCKALELIKSDYARFSNARDMFLHCPLENASKSVGRIRKALTAVRESLGIATAVR